MLLAGIALAAFVATLFGGLFALRLKDKLHVILGFSAGAILAVAFFDLLPEALSLVGSRVSPTMVLSIVALGFTVYLILDRMVLLHSHTHTLDGAELRGTAGAGSLSVHSFLDGLGIGLAFQVTPAVGLIVAAAVLAHDFSDGINTVNMVLKHGGTRHTAFRWLFVDALAPVLGVGASLFFTVSESTLGLLLALFAGFFLYIGASDLIPESYHSHPKHWTTVMTVLGIVTLYTIIRLASV